MSIFSKLTRALCALLIILSACNRDNNNPTPQSEMSVDGPSHFDELKELNWLVGNWVDDEKDIDLTISYKWDKNRNFLIQHFVINKEGKEDFEGTQYIGWDPQQQKIRSWIFDSDGTFGEGEWFIDKNYIYANMIFTLDDGRKASVSHTYSKVDDNTYTFSADDNDIDGELFPNMGPFKVVRR